MNEIQVEIRFKGVRKKPSFPRSNHSRPSRAGTFWHIPGTWGVLNNKEPVFFASGGGKTVLVEEAVASGRFCRELRQGGSALCGLAPWSGFWMKQTQSDAVEGGGEWGQ